MKLRLVIIPLFALLLIPSFSSQVEAKNILFKMSNAEPVVFNHDFHLAKYNKNCRICHNAIFNLNERKHYAMVEMEKGKSCGACHNGIKAFNVADDKRCDGCHTGKPRTINFKPKGIAEVSFSHSAHLAKTGGKCKTCHNDKIISGKQAPVTMAQMEKGKTCGACHNDKTAFSVAGNCDKCHKGFKPATIIFRTDAGDATFSHEFHLGMFKCADCHTKRFPFKKGIQKVSMTEMEAGKSCGGCHNGSDAFSVKSDCAKCHKM